MENEQKKFKLVSDYQPTGDQPQAIETLVKGFREGNQCQTLLGVTGVWQDFYDGECDPAVEQADFDYCAQ